MSIKDKINFEKMNGLIPVVTVDNRSEKVLMVGFMDREAFEKTLENKEMYYFSRTRNKIWKKGERSGNIQKVISLRTDCDYDSLVVEVIQEGVVCHEGKESCFFNEIIGRIENTEDNAEVINEIIGVIRARKTNPKKESYVCKLLDDEVKVEDKIMEEAKELIESEKEGDLVWEAADLLFFILVYLEKNNISYEEVLKELKKRRR